MLAKGAIVTLISDQQGDVEVWGEFFVYFIPQP
jgi:hypothetical protein